MSLWMADNREELVSQGTRQDVLKFARAEGFPAVVYLVYLSVIQ